MIGCQRIPLTEVRDIFNFRIYLCQYVYALSYQYFQFMYITCIYFSYHCFWMVYCTFWVFVCVCCAAPDKLTPPPPFTGLGALHFGIRALGSKPAAWGDALGLPEGRIRVSTPSTVIK